MFTVAQTPNASRGQLSVNQSGLAAWTAVLGSVSVLSNTAATYARVAPPTSTFSNLLIEPIANAPLIQAMVDGINRTRTEYLELDAGQVPGGGGTGSGNGTATLSGNSLAVYATFTGLSARATVARIHGPAARGANAAVLYPLNLTTTVGGGAGTMNSTVTLVNGTGGFTIAQQIEQLQAGLWYINLESTAYPNGEIRGQLLDHMVFHSVGELLAVPELSYGHVIVPKKQPQEVFSPFLNLNSEDFRSYSLNDEAYERIPREILSLLKVGDARYVVYSFGQSLKPADKSIVTDITQQKYFGMCTNYQVTGEVFTRAVVKLEGNPKNPKPVVLNFNILPAD
jgi:hypothetical protein